MSIFSTIKNVIAPPKNDIRTGPSTTITTYKDNTQSVAGATTGGNAYIQSQIDKAYATTSGGSRSSGGGGRSGGGGSSPGLSITQTEPEIQEATGQTHNVSSLPTGFTGRVEQYGQFQNTSTALPEKTTYYSYGKQVGSYQPTGTGKGKFTGSVSQPTEFNLSTGEKVRLNKNQITTQTPAKQTRQPAPIPTSTPIDFQKVYEQLPELRLQLSPLQRLSIAYGSGMTPKQLRANAYVNVRGGIRAFSELVEIGVEKLNIPKGPPISTKSLEDVGIYTLFSPAFVTSPTIAKQIMSSQQKDIFSVSFQGKGTGNKVYTATGFQSTDESISGYAKGVSDKVGDTIKTNVRGYVGEPGSPLSSASRFSGAVNSKSQRGTGILNFFEGGNVKVYNEVPIEATAGKGIVYQKEAKFVVNPIDVANTPRLDILPKNVEEFYSKGFSLGEGKSAFTLGAVKTAGKSAPTYSGFGIVLGGEKSVAEGYSGFVFREMIQPEVTKSFSVKSPGKSYTILSPEQKQIYEKALSDVLSTATKSVQTKIPISFPSAVPVSSAVTKVIDLPLQQQAPIMSSREYQSVPQTSPTFPKESQATKDINKMTASTITFPSQRTRSKSSTSLKQILSPQQNQNQKNIPIVIPKFNEAQDTKQRTRVVSALKMIQRQETTKTPVIKIPNFFREPKEKPFVYMQTRSNPIKIPGSFNVFVRTRGTFKPRGVRLPLMKALKIGEDVTQRELSQTFKIERAGGGAIDFGAPKGYYKKYTKKGILFIEKSPTKINTSQEKYLLQVARGFRRKKK